MKRIKLPALIRPRIPRDHPLVNLVAASMEITPQQVDEAWPTILSI